MENKFVTLIHCKTGDEITVNVNYIIRFEAEDKGTRIILFDTNGQLDFCATIGYTHLKSIVKAVSGH